ncbi:MAG: S49 family peptidase [Pseudomonadota bacterium]
MRFWRKKGVVVPVVRLSGVIGAGGNLRPGLTLNAVAGPLEKAFKMKGPAVALAINSPGGSPVQSSLIGTRIRALAVEHDKTVFAFVEDVAASGGYWLACAADEIIADASSVVGSIGVVSASFGFTELIEKIGVERRVYTTGENKSILDPFKPEKDSDLAILRGVQTDILDAFVTHVKSRRGAKLTDHPDMFTGRFWTGTSALPLGLIDAVGDMRSTVRARYGEKATLRLVPMQRGGFLRGRLGLETGLSAEALIGAIRSDRLWDRYGI